MNYEPSPIKLSESVAPPPPTYSQLEGQSAVHLSSNATHEGDNVPGHIQIKSTNPMMQDLNQLIKWHADGTLSDSEFKIAKQKLMIKPATSMAVTTTLNIKPKDISLRVQQDNRPAIPANAGTLLGIRPNLRERVIVDVSGSITVEVGLPQQLRDRGFTESEWDQMIGELNAIGGKACHYPCHWIYIFMHILCFAVLFLTMIWLLYVLCPYGWCFDYHQKFLKQWIKKWNDELRPRGFYLKFQNIKRDFHEKKYLCIAFTPEEIHKLQSEPAFQRGQDVWHQEAGDARGCPIDAHRII